MKFEMAYWYRLKELRDMVEEAYARSQDPWWMEQREWCERRLAENRLEELRGMKRKAEETYARTEEPWWKGIIEWADSMIAETSLWI